MSLRRSASSNSLLLFILLHLVFYISMAFDIFLVRQFSAFIYLTFVPGFLLLRLLRIDKLDRTEMLLLSLGLSLAFLMLLSLVVNWLYPFAGISAPLSIVPFTLTLSIVLFVFFAIVNRKEILLPKVDFTFNYLIILVLVLPIVGLIGTFMVNVCGNSSLLLVAIAMVCAVVAVVVMSDKPLLKECYPIIIAAIVIGLMSFANASLITNYITGWDSHNEFQAFKLAKINGYWTSQLIRGIDIQTLKSNAAISTTILPVIYSQILGIDDSLLFKLIFPFFAIFVSLGIYKLYCTQVDKKTAFLSVFFFITISMGIAGWGSNKQIIAAFFLVLIFLIIFRTNSFSSGSKLALFILSFALVISHYSLSYIFLFIITMTLILLMVLRKKSNKITLPFVISYATFNFGWFIYVSGAVTFSEFVDTFSRVFANLLSEFFSPESRGEQVLSGLGLTTAVSYVHQIGRIFVYTTELLVLIGFVKCVYDLIKNRKWNFEKEYTLMTFVSMIMLGMNVVVPNLASSFLMTRFYQTTLILASPLCILGGYAVLSVHRKISKKTMTRIITLGVLIPSLLFGTGFVYEITGVRSWSIPLSIYRLRDEVWLYDNIVTQQEVMSATWLPGNTNTSAVTIYADSISKYHVLASYGLIFAKNVEVLSNNTLPSEGFVYLRRVNVVNGIIEGENLFQYNASSIDFFLESKDQVYSNGECSIYR